LATSSGNAAVGNNGIAARSVSCAKALFIESSSKTMNHTAPSKNVFLISTTHMIQPESKDNPIPAALINSLKSLCSSFRNLENQLL